MATPAQNRKDMELLARDTGVFKYPRGDFMVAGPPDIPSNTRLIAHDGGSRHVNTLGGPAFACVAKGLGYTQPDHAQPPLTPGRKVCWFRYDGVYNPDGLGQLCQWSTVVSITGSNIVTNPPKDVRHTAIFCVSKAWSIIAPFSSGALAVTVTDPVDSLIVGMTVFITPGPTVQNAAWGEYRKIVAVEGTAVRFDRPLSEAYPIGTVIASVQAIQNVTVEGLDIIAQPNGNPVTWGSMWKGVVGLSLVNVGSNGATDIITCDNPKIVEPRLGPIQFNTTRDAIILGGRLTALYAEEKTDGVRVCGSTIGPAVQANCVTGFFEVNRMRFRDVTVIGDGDLVGDYPASAFNVHGIDNMLSSVIVKDSRGGWTLLGGTGLTVEAFRTVGAMQILSPKSASVNNVRGPWNELLTAGDAFCNVADINNCTAVQGWNVVPQTVKSPTKFQSRRAPQSVQTHTRFHDLLMQQPWRQKR